MNEVRSSRPIETLLGSAVPKPCFTQTLPRRHHTKIGSKQQRRVRPKTGRTRLQLRLKIQYLQSPECVWAAGAICACPPCLPKSAAGGGSQWREAFILTIDGWRLLRYCHCQFASHRTISVAAAQITLSAAPSRGIDVQPHRCYNENTISDTGHHADADGLKGLTGGCIFNFR